MPLIMSPTIGKLSEALAAAQAEMQPAKKNATNPHYRSTYADLASLIEASRPVLARHGLAVSQVTERREDGTTCLTTLLLHSSGEYLGGESGGRLAQDTPQAAGSLWTYHRRYGYASIVGIATEDDDGAAAMPPARPVEQRPAPAHRDEPAQVAVPAVASDRNDPPCPKCRGAMWDNRGTPERPKANPKAPDFKCRDKACDGVIWPPRTGSSHRPPAQVMDAPPPPDDGEIPF